MPDRVFIARLFLISGAVLAVFGMILWFTLPIPAMFPPYLVTALLALVYGVVWNCRRETPRLVQVDAKPEPLNLEISKVEVAKAKVLKLEVLQAEVTKPAPKKEASKSEAPKKEVPRP